MAGAHHLQQCRANKRQESHHDCDRVAGQAEQDGRPAVGRGDPAHGHRPSWSHGDAPECNTSAGTGQFFHHRLGVIGLAHTDATAGDDGIGLSGGRHERFLQGRGLVADHPQVDHLDAQAAQQPENRVAVAVVDRTRAGWLAQAQDLVAGGKIGDTQSAHYAHPGHAQAGDQPQRRGPEQIAACERRLPLQQVFAQTTPVVALADHCGRKRDRSAVELDQFQWYDRVESGWHHGASGDLDGFAAADRSAPDIPCQRAADHLQHERHAICERRAIEGKPVHGRVVMRRHADRGHQVLRQNPSECLKYRCFLGFDDRFHQTLQEQVHVGCAQALRVVTLKLGGYLVD
jgi:hypothetical protein